MGRHVPFWVGFFTAALLIVPVAMGIWGLAGDVARDIAVFLFGAMAALIVLLVAVLFFRDRILKAALGRAEASIDATAAALVSGVSAATAGDRDAAEAEAAKLVQAAVSWYAWSNFYRWVIATALGLLLAFGAFVGTVLLFEQTRKLTEQTELMSAQTGLMTSQTERMEEQTTQFRMQNELMGLSLVSEIRDQLLSTVETAPVTEWLASLGVEGLDQPLFTARGAGCGIQLNPAHVLHRPPSGSTLGAVRALAEKGLLAEQVLQALRLLSRDDHGAVALGAIMVLGELGELDPDDSPFRVRDVFVDQLLLEGSSVIRLEESFAIDIDCADCKLRLARSIVRAIRAAEVSGFETIAIGNMRSASALEGIRIVYQDEPNEEDFPNAALDVGPWFAGPEFAAFLTGTEPSDACRMLRVMGRTNPMLLQAP